MTSRELTSGFDLWSRGHLRMAVMHLHKIWCRYLYPVRSYWQFSEIQDGGRRHLGFSDYVNLVIRVCWQCGICVLYEIGLKLYALQYWDRRTYASDVHLMTSRELTSGFDFWSRGHLRMAVMHLPVKFGAGIFIQSELLTFFRNSRWRPPPSWIFRLCEFGNSGV